MLCQADDRLLLITERVKPSAASQRAASPQPLQSLAEPVSTPHSSAHKPAVPAVDEDRGDLVLQVLACSAAAWLGST